MRKLAVGIRGRNGCFGKRKGEGQRGVEKLKQIPVTRGWQRTERGRKAKERNEEKAKEEEEIG